MKTSLSILVTCVVVSVQAALGGRTRQGPVAPDRDGNYESFYFYEKFRANESKIIYQAGPMTVYAGCYDRGYTGAFLEMSLLNEKKDMVVYGDLTAAGVNSPPIVNHTLSKGDLFERAMWRYARAGTGNDIDDGALWVSTGHYVGWDGESTIGVVGLDDNELSALGPGIRCAMSGVLNYFIPTGKSKKGSDYGNAYGISDTYGKLYGNEYGKKEYDNSNKYGKNKYGNKDSDYSDYSDYSHGKNEYENNNKYGKKEYGNEYRKEESYGSGYRGGYGTSGGSGGYKNNRAGNKGYHGYGRDDKNKNRGGNHGLPPPFMN